MPQYRWHSDRPVDPRAIEEEEKQRWREEMRQRQKKQVMAGVPALMSANRIPKQTNTEEAVGS